MTDEDDIVNILRVEEKLGKIQKKKKEDPE